MKARLVTLSQRIAQQCGRLWAQLAAKRSAGSTGPAESQAGSTSARGQAATTLRGSWRDRESEIAQIKHTAGSGQDKAKPATTGAMVSSLIWQSAEHIKPVVHQSVRVIPLRQLRWKLLLVTLLSVVTVGSCLAVIFSAYQNRLLFDEHQKLQQQRDDLQSEWGQLLLEQSAWAAAARVEKTARQQLDMQAPVPQQIEMVQRGN